MDSSGPTCEQCGATFRHWSEVAAHREAEHGPIEQGTFDKWSERIGVLLGGVVSIVFAVIVGAVIVGVVLQVFFGVFDSKSVDEDRSSPGYDFVRQLQEDGAIEEFRAVEPEGKWDTQYELDGETELRFREGAGETKLEVSGFDNDLIAAVGAEAEARGYGTQDD